MMEWWCCIIVIFNLPMLRSWTTRLTATEQDEIFQQNMTSQEDYDKIVMQFQNLQETYEELLSCKVIVSKEDFCLLYTSRCV